MEKNFFKPKHSFLPNCIQQHKDAQDITHITTLNDEGKWIMIKHIKKPIEKLKRIKAADKKGDNTDADQNYPATF
jgi:hypothetical protein